MKAPVENKVLCSFVMREEGLVSEDERGKDFKTTFVENFHFRLFSLLPPLLFSHSPIRHPAPSNLKSPDSGRSVNSRQSGDHSAVSF